MIEGMEEEQGLRSKLGSPSYSSELDHSYEVPPRLGTVSPVISRIRSEKSIQHHIYCLGYEYSFNIIQEDGLSLGKIQ